ncbi:hypothetical protein [Vulcanisaeta distributa]|uniref:hypothetical protein n=1 Tax=Vulcanisaeta distributa TaxID=164451 RepID=UPI0006D262B5|nr:hypothetical protein [Vulcanisaeta distributa]
MCGGEVCGLFRELSRASLNGDDSLMLRVLLTLASRYAERVGSEALGDFLSALVGRVNDTELVKALQRLTEGGIGSLLSTWLS